MTEIERIQNDLDKGYTVTRYGNTKSIHEQMLKDIKYLNDLAKNNESLQNVSCCDEKIKVGQVWKRHDYGNQGKIVILKIDNDNIHFSSLSGSNVCELVQIWTKNEITGLFSLKDDMYVNIK